MGLFSSEQKKIGIAIVGLGYISQGAAIPAVERTNNCTIAALVSSDQKKLKELGEKYDVENLYSYERFEECLKQSGVDAVYIGLPNSLHKEYVLRAAKAGKHILCEKPMAVTSQDCKEMIAACEEAGVKLMMGYRLHFEKTNMKALESIQKEEIGEVRLISAAFGQQVKSGDIRTNARLGGGALYDMGIYCLNAARYFFQQEPRRVAGMVSNPADPRFKDVDGFTGALLEFGQGKIASFVTSLGCGEISSCTVVGEKGVIKLDPAFDFQVALKSEVFVDGKRTRSDEVRSDQFAGELQKFAEYILNDTPVEPDGYEGLADVMIIEAILESAQTGKVIELSFDFEPRRPVPEERITISAGEMPELTNASPPSN